jgi:predicted RNA methylase
MGAEEIDPYFKSYTSLEVHEKMLRDEKRTDTYHDAINKNRSLFKDKVVMDLGAGTAILSIFAARAGAKKVYAVEKSGIALCAIQIVNENGLSDKI